MELNQGQWVDYWRGKLAVAWQRRTRHPHGPIRRMSIAHPIKALRGWLKVAQDTPDGSPVQCPAV